MPKDPAFLFYPGDYLRDTQCLSEKTQVAYDRIICEHMRNICITQEQLNFFTKKLTEEEKSELLMVVQKIKGGYQIEWVAESIGRRRLYSESRSKNRNSKPPKNPIDICTSYVPHMENAIENEIAVNVFNKKEVLTEIEIGSTIEYVSITSQKHLTKDQILKYWEAFKIQYQAKVYFTESGKLEHFRDWLKKQDHATTKRVDTARPGSILSPL